MLVVINVLLVLFEKNAANKGWRIVVRIVWALLIGALLFWLCRECHTGWAWFVLLLPLIITFFIVFAVLIGVGAGVGASIASK